jgi:RNA polymerase sigma factor (sigma-70 family)
VTESPIRLLLVDDHATFRQPLAFMLGREPDFEVIAQAGSLAETQAIAPAIRSQVDVALVDLKLPDGDGTEIIREMRAADSRGHALVLTADPDKMHHAQAIEAGAVGVLSKTAELPVVFRAIRRAHAGEPVQSTHEVMELVRLACERRERDQVTQTVLARLTPRERQVLQALAQGLDNKAIADRLYISPETARTHVVKLLAKLNVESRLQAAIFAIRHGIGT